MTQIIADYFTDNPRVISEYLCHICGYQRISVKYMKRIYFDHSATTPIDPQVFAAMLPYLKEIYGNASSLHWEGQEAQKAVLASRDKLAAFLGCQPSEVIFTSGASESDNLALQGVMKYFRESVKSEDKKYNHLITTAFEHPAVLETAQAMEKEGHQVTYLKPNNLGLINVKQVEQAIKDETILVLVMYVNNEVGTIQPIAEIGKLIKEINQQREKNKQRKIIFHTDAVQAVNFCPCQVKDLAVDLLSLSSHKIYGPKGVGALYVKKGTPIKRITHGGHQEYGFRAGTLNTPGIVGLGKAIDLLSNQKEQGKINQRIRKLRDKIVNRMLKEIKNVQINGDLKQRVPANINFRFKNVEGESLMLLLDLEGFAVSTGSACASGSLKPSHVLISMGIPQEEAHGSLRITLGKGNTEEEVNKFLKALPLIINKLRKISPFK